MNTLMIWQKVILWITVQGYCVGLLTTQELNSLVEECIIDNGGEVFGTKNDKGFYVVKSEE